jgi:predicted GNAT family acetyltransferase
MNWTIIHEEQGQKGRFLIRGEQGDMGEMTYVYAGSDKIIIDHTEVDPVLRGQNAGKKLVEAAAAWARQAGLKIIPLCPFTKATMLKNREFYEDVLA